jgi:hypothetical protein
VLNTFLLKTYKVACVSCNSTLSDRANKSEDLVPTKDSIKGQKAFLKAYMEFSGTELVFQGQVQIPLSELNAQN